MGQARINDVAIRAAMADKPSAVGERVKLVLGIIFILTVSYGFGVVAGGDKLF
jgi:hypothetical protein